jgi:hypothetical protein
MIPGFDPVIGEENGKNTKYQVVRHNTSHVVPRHAVSAVFFLALNLETIAQFAKLSGYPTVVCDVLSRIARQQCDPQTRALVQHLAEWEKSYPMPVLMGERMEVTEWMQHLLGEVFDAIPLLPQAVQAAA